MSGSSKGYKFELSGTTVSAVYEVERGRMKLERIDSDETWSFDGKQVIKTEWDDGRLETTAYADADGDGLFFKTGKSYSGAVAPRYDDHNDNDHSNDNDHGVSSGLNPAAPGVFVRAEENYRFDIGADGQVTAVYEVENGRVSPERMDWNETWTFDGLDVIQTTTRFGKIETTLYTDDNQDGLFQKGFEVEVMTGENPRALDIHTFSLADGSNAIGGLVAEGDLITGMMELGRRGWKADRIDANESLQVVEVDGDSLILKTAMQRDGSIEFNVFRDENNDGLWTEIADGETRDVFVTLEGGVDVVGMADAGLLQAADALMA